MNSAHTNNDLSLVLFPSRTIPLESVQLIFKSRHVPNLCDGSTSFCKETFSQSSPRVPLDLSLCKYLGFSYSSWNQQILDHKCIKCSFSAGNFSCNWPLQHTSVHPLCNSSAVALADFAELQEEYLLAPKRAMTDPLFGQCDQPGPVRTHRFSLAVKHPTLAFKLPASLSLTGLRIWEET